MHGLAHVILLVGYTIWTGGSHSTQHRLLNDSDDGHMDSAQGLTLFKLMNKFNTSTGKHRNEMFKLLFDKKTGSLGGIYEDMKRFKQIYPKADSTFEKAFAELYV